MDIHEFIEKCHKGSASDIKVGDYVFDAFGGTYVVKRVTAGKNVVRFVRDDGYRWTWRKDDLVTFVSS